MSDEIKISRLLYKERKFIFISVFIFLCGAVIVTLITDKKYLSTAIVYPTETNSLDDAFERPKFGFEIQGEHLIQIFTSQIVQDSLVNKFDLVAYYELDTASVNWRDQLNRNMAEDIRFERSRYLSVVITVVTTSPQLSADIANYLVEIIDKVKENILKENDHQAYSIYKKSYDRQQQIVDSLLNILEDKNKLKKVSSQRAELIQGDYYSEVKRLKFFKNKLRHATDKVNKPMPKVYKISRAIANEKKVSPSGLVNALIGCGLGFLVALFAILIRTKFNEIKPRV